MNWQILSSDTPQTPAEVVRVLLENREISDEDEIENFLSPQPFNHSIIRQLRQLFDETQLERATKIVKEAVATDAPIIIHGDYDVDGVSATAVLWETLYYDLNYQNARPFIPHRIDHGYGVSVESIDSILADLDSSQSPIANRQPLLITVDCGITSKEAIAYAKEQGFNVIVTDHHTPPENESDLPPADALLYSTKLSGTGVAWVLSLALKSTPRDSASNSATFRDRLDLVALATIADILPLTGYNRQLVREGLGKLTKTQRAGLRALKQVAKVEGEVNPYHVGWLLGPRLNATGRLETAMDALRLLCTRSPQRALQLANKLNQLNWQRQQMTKEALTQAENSVTEEDKIIVLSNPDWHEGIIGLIAGKLTEKFYRPAIVIAEGEEVSKASARSVKGVSVVEIIREHEDLLLGAGGHELAAGFSIETSKISDFELRISDFEHPTLQEAIATGPSLKIDLPLSPDVIDWDLYQALVRLEPHGFGNPRPVFVTHGLIVDNMRAVGSDKSHLQLTFNTQHLTLNAIAFGLAEKANNLGIDIASQIDIVYTLDKDDYRGGESVQLKIKDFERSN